MLLVSSHLAGYPVSRSLKSSVDLNKRVISGQPNEVTVGGIGLRAICIFRGFAGSSEGQV